MIHEIRYHGRGGQGAVTSTQLLAVSAFYDNKYATAFPSFGSERSGAPVQSFARISDSMEEKIYTKEGIHHPDIVVVLDDSLLELPEVIEGKKDSTLFIINSDLSSSDLKKKLNTENLYSIDMTSKAIEIIGKPFVNVMSLGAFAALTSLITMPSLKKAIYERFSSEKVASLNYKASEILYEMIKNA